MTNAKIFWKPKEVLYQVSTDLGEVNSFYSSFSCGGQKAPLLCKSSKESAWCRVKCEEKDINITIKEKSIVGKLTDIC